MREQLIKYVELLFAGTQDADDMRQEILQNSLDRYDDLIDQGKSPEAAYRLAIGGIGDINEMLGTKAMTEPAATAAEEDTDYRGRPLASRRKTTRAIAIGMYICSAIPLFLWGSIGDGVIGLSITCLLVAAATALIVLSSDSSSAKNTQENEEKRKELTPQQELRRNIQKTLSTIALVLFLVVSFLTGAWYITWLIFPIMTAIKGLIFAIMDLKEAKSNEA